MSKQYFHFTIGPVQGFVAQARRTRDLWAGSFLLSYLSAVALTETREQQGEILFPEPDKNFLAALEGKTDPKNLPQQGSIPNRFKAEVSEKFSPEKVLQAVQTAWLAICNGVLKNDLSHRDIWGDNQQKNWDSQVNHFWEMTWAISENKQDSSILDKRKNWRAHIQPTQFGDKCMMMEGYQELSAEPRPNTQKQKAFWAQIQKDVRLDLREKEKLCAMAFVKRRFVKVFADLSVDMPSGWTLQGWKLAENVPSVQYLAAAHWIEALVNELDNPHVLDAANEFYDIASKHAGRGEFQTRIECIEKAHRATQRHPISNLDGAVFYESLLESNSVFDSTASSEILRALNGLKRTIKDIADLSPYYAILLMDGDSLGVQMSDEKKQPIISKALDEFTRAVPGVIQRNNGFLIYAGGDDVLAILPLEDAIRAAIDCRNAYENCFKDTIVNSSLSGAIEYVHIKSPLMKAIHQSHYLLDEIAKDQTGRDALAIRINKPGNENALWSMPWEKALNAEGQLRLEALTNRFILKGIEQQGFSSKFIYSLRDKYAGFDFSDFSQDQIKSLILTDYISSDSALSDFSEASALIDELLEQMNKYSRASVNDNFEQHALNIDINAGLVARFLAQKGIE